MVDISSQNNKINVTVSSNGNTANVNATPDSAKYYSDKSKEWAISDKIVDNADYSSKYYANESKKQADISTAKATEVIESGNTAVSNIESARDNAIIDVNTAGATQVALATEQATIATNKASEVIESGNTALSNIDTAKNNAITSITNQETTSRNVLIDEGATQVGLIQNEGATQVNLAKEQVTLATNQANIATEQATIATSQASIATSKTAEVVESGNTALSNIETAKSNALNDINTTGAEYVNNAGQYAQNALNSANNAKESEDNALSYKNSAMESSQTATEQANIATTSATNAKTSETNAKSSETRCEEILSRLGTAIKIKGRVDSVGDLPLSGNLDGDAYLVGVEGLDSYPEYYWYKDHWEFLGTSGTSLSWGLISGDITAQTDLQTALDSKQDKGNYALKSEIPTNNNQLINGAGYITADYHDNTKQDVILDLATIRSGASKGATALQSIPAEYITESELNAKGYLTSYTETDPVYTADKANIANIDLSNLNEAGIQAIKTISQEELNNPFSLFDSKYSDHELNNLSWLKSEGQWNAKAVYTDAYDKLLKVYNGTETVEGLSVKLSTGTYTDYDFVLNTAEETFRLPLLDGSETIPDYQNYTEKTTVGSYVAERNCVVSYFSGTTTGNGAGGALIVDSIKVSQLTSTNATVNASKIAFVKRGHAYSLESAATFEYCRIFPCIGNGSLYFYVGETVQNANLIDAGRIGEQLASKVDISNTQWAANASTPDMGKPITLSNNSSANPYNYDYPVLLFLTGANTKTDMHLLVSTTANGTAYYQLLPGAPPSGTRVSFSWLIPANYNFYFNNTSVVTAFPLLGGNY